MRRAGAQQQLSKFDCPDVQETIARGLAQDVKGVSDE